MPMPNIKMKKVDDDDTKLIDLKVYITIITASIFVNIFSDFELQNYNRFTKNSILYCIQKNSLI